MCQGLAFNLYVIKRKVETMEFECCFCKEIIKETSVDPVCISVLFNESAGQQTRSCQFYFTHYACLKEKIHIDAIDYLRAATEGQTTE